MRTPTQTILATLLATTVMVVPAYAQDAAEEATNDDIIVTAQA
jgi:hypothetical protein